MPAVVEDDAAGSARKPEGPCRCGLAGRIGESRRIRLGIAENLEFRGRSGYSDSDVSGSVDPHAFGVSGQECQSSRGSGPGIHVSKPGYLGGRIYAEFEPVVVRPRIGARLRNEERVSVGISGYDASIDVERRARRSGVDSDSRAVDSQFLGVVGIESELTCGISRTRSEKSGIAVSTERKSVRGIVYRVGRALLGRKNSGFHLAFDVEFRLGIRRSDSDVFGSVGEVGSAQGVGPCRKSRPVEIRRLDFAELAGIVPDVRGIPEHVREQETDVPLGIRHAGRKGRIGSLDGSDGLGNGKRRNGLDDRGKRDRQRREGGERFQLVGFHGKGVNSNLWDFATKSPPTQAHIEKSGRRRWRFQKARISSPGIPYQKQYADPARREEDRRHRLRGALRPLHRVHRGHRLPRRTSPQRVRNRPYRNRERPHRQGDRWKMRSLQRVLRRKEGRSRERRMFAEIRRDGGRD